MAGGRLLAGRLTFADGPVEGEASDVPVRGAGWDVLAVLVATYTFK